MTPLRRRLLAAGGLLLAVLAGGGWWLYVQLDAIIKRAITHYGSQMTQARVSVDAVQLRSTDGIGIVRGLEVGNPTGFRSAHAIKVGVIEVAVDVRTLADPVVVIRRIVIDAPDIVYEQGESLTNFDAIQQNIARSLAGGSSEGGASQKTARKLIVDELIIRRARAKVSAAALMGQTVSTTLPDITLRRLGRAEGGLTPAQLGQIVARTLSQRLVASLVIDKTVKSLGDRVKGLFGR
jgi:hypothetical protein